MALVPGSRLPRRRFLRAAGLSVAATAVGHSLVSAAGQRPPSPSADAVPARVHAVLTAYDAQGAHRTGTDVDRVSGDG